MLAHGEATRNMDRLEYLGNSILLIVGGNDTLYLRNTMTGSIVALNQFPGPVQAKLRKSRNPSPDPPADGLRNHPLADPAGPHAPHRQRPDIELGGKTIKKGDKVIMWCTSRATATI